MLSLLLLLALTALTCAQVPGLGFGPTYMMQRTSSYLVEYSTTLRVPKYPDSSKGLIVIWPGINTDARPTNLVQTCIGAAAARPSFCYDKAKGQQWCAFTSTNIGITKQKAGKGLPIEAGKDLFITYKYDESTKEFAQTLSIDGREVSHQSLAIGKGNRFNTAVEVQYGFSGTILAHSKSPTLTLIHVSPFSIPAATSVSTRSVTGYLSVFATAYKNNTFKFAAADPGFPRSLRIDKGVTASKPVTKDGGKTWTVDEIMIPDSKYGSAKTAAAAASRKASTPTP
ncbi:hypothetical protein FKW77_003058 [Venturia effusa]|uniref:Uncharacterized protein n=1 Tax=Venturia effusa TaxID=50376 RepID=A0A517LF97_9PEZI|nr:hypothetical protein FKW77_003058 [Venturia effusa]